MLSVLQVEELQLSQPLLSGEVLQLSTHFHGLAPTGPYPCVPELNAALQVGTYKSRVEGKNDIFSLLGMFLWVQLRILLAFWAGSTHELVAHVQLFIHDKPEVLFIRAALNEFSPSLYSLCPGWMLFLVHLINHLINFASSNILGGGKNIVMVY